MSARGLALGLALALGLGACSDTLPEAPAAGGGIRLQLRAATAGTSTDAFAKTDAAHVHLTQGDAVLMDSTLTFSSGGNGEIPLTVQLSNPTGTVVLALDLLARGQVLFQGSGQAALQRGVTTTVDVTLSPVVTLSAPDSVLLTALGDTVRLGGAVVFATGDTLTGSRVTWSGGGPVAQVTADGLAIARAEGATQATAMYQAFARTTRIRVQAVVTRVTVSPDTASVVVGSSQALTAAAFDRRGNALTRAFTWQSSNPAVATVDATGVVTGVGPGTATITASTQGQSASAVVTVYRVPVAAVQVTPASATLVIGSTIQLTATTLDAAGAVLTGRAVAWSSGDPTVASVSASGLVTAIAGGAVTITATSEGVTGSARITVGQPILTVNPARLGFQTVAAAGAPAAQTVSVSNTGVGSITGLSAGASYPAGAPGGWITTLSLTSTTAPATLTVGVDPSGLQTGSTYSGTVSVSSGNAGTVSIPVFFTVTQPILSVSTTQVAASTEPDTMSVGVANAGSGTLAGLTASIQYNDALTGWLTASFQGGNTTAPTTLLLIIPANAPSPGYYQSSTATVTVSSGVPGAGTAQITVTFNGPVIF